MRVDGSRIRKEKVADSKISGYVWTGPKREVKHDVYGKRQTAKMKLLPSLFSCMYSRVKLFVFAMNSRRRYSIFVCVIYGLE